MALCFLLRVSFFFFCLRGAFVADASLGMRNVHVKRKHHNVHVHEDGAVHAAYEVGSRAEVGSHAHVSLMRSRQVPPGVVPVTTPFVDVAMTTAAIAADPSLTSAPSDPSDPDAGLLYNVGVGLVFVVVGFGVAMYFGRGGGDSGSRSGHVVPGVRSRTVTQGGMAGGIFESQKSNGTNGTPSSVARMAGTHVDVDTGLAAAARDERITAHRKGMVAMTESMGCTDSDDDLPVKPPPVRHGVKTDAAEAKPRPALKSNSANSHQLGTEGRERAGSSYKVRGDQSPSRAESSSK